MRKKIFFAVLTICIAVLSTVTAFGDAYARPRVLTTKQGIDDAIARIETDETVAGWYNSVLNQANNYLKTDLITEDSSAEMMTEARNLKSRILSLGFVYFKTGIDEYAQRACDEVITACGFDWGYNASFLGVAEMAFGVALGYDWLYDEFTKEERALIEKTLMEKAIIPYYNDITNDIWWEKSESNWNIVCNGGVLTAIIALDEKAGNTGSEAFAIGLENINSMMPLFGPDGAWEEGLMYWRFTTEYFANFFSTLINYSGMDFGYCEWEGVDKTGYYPYLMSGAGGGFSYSDCDVRRENAPQVFWLASYFDDTALAGARLNDMKRYKQSAEVRDILWYNGKNSEPVLSRDNYFGRVEAFSMRDTYENTDGIFLAGKGGQIGISHSHFDAGSFVLDALGKRFVTDLGREDYSVTVEDDYQLYRNRAEGHNTLVINPSVGYDQTRDCVSKIVDFKSGENAALSVIDLTPAYKDAVDMKRGFFFDRERQSILLQDEITLKKESDIWWFVHTGAAVTLSGDRKTATLNIGGKKLYARIKGDNDYSFDIMDAKPFSSSLPVAKQNANNGIKKLAINIKDAYNATIRVSFTPAGSEEGIFDEFVPMQNWDIIEGLFITSDKNSIAPGESFDFNAKLVTAQGVSEPNNARWYLEKAYVGVSIEPTTGKLCVADTAKNGNVTVVVKNGAKVAKKTVNIAPITFTFESMPLSALIPSDGTILTIKPKYSVRYKNGGMVENESLYTLKWRLKEPVCGVSIDEKSGFITIDSAAEGEYAEFVAELDGKTVLSRKLYFTTKSLSSSEMGAIAWDFINFGKDLHNIMDGDINTYMDTGAHTANSDGRVFLKLADEPVTYNKVRVTMEHTENTKELMLTASDTLVGEEPEETIAYKSGDNIPILYPNYSPGGQMIYVSKAAPKSTSVIINISEMESKYLSFENKYRGKGDIPNFLLNEIEVFDSTAGNALMTVNDENPKLIKCSVVLFDTEGDAMKTDGNGKWSLENNPAGVTINQEGEITVKSSAEKKDITICYTYTADKSVVEARKTINAGFLEKLSDKGEESVKIEKGKMYIAEFNGEGEHILAMYRIENGVRSLYYVQLSGGMIVVPNDGCEYEIKLMRMDMNTMMPLCECQTYGT